MTFISKGKKWTSFQVLHSARAHRQTHISAIEQHNHQHHSPPTQSSPTVQLRTDIPPQQIVHHHSYTQHFQSPQMAQNFHNHDTPQAQSLLLFLICFAGLMEITSTLSICHLLILEYHVLLILPLIQIMASLYLGGQDWGFSLSIAGIAVQPHLYQSFPTGDPQCHICKVYGHSIGSRHRIECYQVFFQMLSSWRMCNLLSSRNYFDLPYWRMKTLIQIFQDYTRDSRSRGLKIDRNHNCIVDTLVCLTFSFLDLQHQAYVPICS